MTKILYMGFVGYEEREDVLTKLRSVSQSAESVVSFTVN